MRRSAQRLYQWLIRRPSYMLLAADDAALAAEAPGRFAHAWFGLMAQSLLWGLILCGAWGLAWEVFRDYDPLVMPALVTMVLLVLWPYRRAAGSLLEMLMPAGAERCVAGAMLVAGLAMCLMTLKGDFQRSEYQLPYWLVWIRPWAKLYRVLLLMPLWGGWSMLIAPQFCRPKDRTEPCLVAVARGCGPVAAAGCLAVPLAGSVFYFHYLGLRAQVTIAVAAGLSAIAAGLVCCRRTGGLTRRALLAANLLTQIAFLVAFLAWARPPAP